DQRMKAGMGVFVIDPVDLKVGGVAPQLLSNVDTRGAQVAVGAGSEEVINGFRPADIAAWNPSLEHSYVVPDLGAFRVLLRTKNESMHAAVLEFPNGKGGMIVSAVDLIALST